MHMLDWNTYRQQLVAGVDGFGKLNPDIVKGYTTLSRAGQKAGHLDEKTRELIALAVAITLRCDGCITFHTAAARERGATREEIAEVLGVAVSVNAGAAVVYSTARSTRSTPPPKSTPTPEELIIGYLRVTLSWTGHSDRAG
jgi:AhpD family alkylhydroperoxidase